MIHQRYITLMSHPLLTTPCLPERKSTSKTQPRTKSSHRPRPQTPRISIPPEPAGMNGYYTQLTGLVRLSMQLLLPHGAALRTNPPHLLHSLALSIPRLIYTYPRKKASAILADSSSKSCSPPLYPASLCRSPCSTHVHAAAAPLYSLRTDITRETVARVAVGSCCADGGSRAPVLSFQDIRV